jgi:hypothetical protein
MFTVQCSIMLGHCTDISQDGCADPPSRGSGSHGSGSGSHGSGILSFTFPEEEMVDWFAELPTIGSPPRAELEMQGQAAAASSASPTPVSQMPASQTESPWAAMDAEPVPAPGRISWFPPPCLLQACKLCARDASQASERSFDSALSILDKAFLLRRVQYFQMLYSSTTAPRCMSPRQVSVCDFFDVDADTACLSVRDNTVQYSTFVFVCTRLWFLSSVRLLLFMRTCLLILYS